MRNEVSRIGRSLRGTSLDCRLFYGYYLVMLGLFLGGHAMLSAFEMTCVAFLFLALLVVVAVRHRIRRRWTWPGSSLHGVMSALVGLVLGLAFFLFASVFLLHRGIPDDLPKDLPGVVEYSLASVQALASRPHFTPWYLIAAGIILANVLTAFKLMAYREEEFQASCDDG